MTFTLPTELAVLRARLESEGIECRVLNELTAQVNPFYSNAIGGVKLQVKESDIQSAIEILKDGGYIKDEDLQPSKAFPKLERATSQIPFLKRMRLEFRLMILVVIVVPVIGFIIYFALLPSLYDRLTKQTWCVDRITYNGKSYTANTIESIQIIGAGFCQETIDMRTNGAIQLPGFNSRSVRGSWELHDNTLQIMQTDTYDFVYNGVYEIDFPGSRLILKSKQTTLSCHPQVIQINVPF